MLSKENILICPNKAWEQNWKKLETLREQDLTAKDLCANILSTIFNFTSFGFVKYQVRRVSLDSTALSKLVMSCCTESKMVCE